MDVMYYLLVGGMLNNVRRILSVLEHEQKIQKIQLVSTATLIVGCILEIPPHAV